MAHFHTIKRIKVNKQEFDIMLISIDMSNESPLLTKYYCAYVYLPKLKDKEGYDNYGNATYKSGKVIGVDTAHIYNKNMTLEEREIDALRQIKEVIKDYLKKYKGKK